VLINTVVMFLQELLPALLLLSTLLIWQRRQVHQLLWTMLSLSLAGLLLLSSQFSRISQWVDGLGLELLYISCYLLTFLLLCSCVYVKQPRLSAILAGLAIASLLLVNGSNLLLFLFVYERNLFSTPAVLLGATLGLGIGLSVAVLWYHLIREISAHSILLFRFVLALLAARQISMAMMLLVQSDWLPTGPMLWNSEHVLSERSEYGHFFNALLGYEATPSVAQLFGFSCSLLLMLWLNRALEVQK
jgi:high-affinity iron transporter